MKIYGGVDVLDHIFLTSELDGCEWSDSLLGSFIPGTHLIGGWMGTRTGLDDVETRKVMFLPGLELRRARSQSLYRLRYLGSYHMPTRFIISYINSAMEQGQTA
jgi:hypothetical protein